MTPKIIHRNSITGQQGITLIHEIVSAMGFLFYPTGGVEAGIDGTIEIRDGVTGAVTNCIIAVQSKATSERFTAETDASFTYRCDERDIDYWMGGNVPVLLVVSRPAAREAYWILVNQYFKDPLIRKSRTVLFNKTETAFTVASKSSLIDIAVPKNTGVYLAPMPRVETLYTNLLPVASFAPSLYTAHTDYTTPAELTQRFSQIGGEFGREWYLKNNRIYTVHDLRQHPWVEVCDQGTVECFDTSDFAESGDEELQRDFVRLLNRCLSAKLRPDVWWERDLKYHYFKPGDSLRTVKKPYQGLQKATSRTVFHAYSAKSDTSRIVYCRHLAMKSFFEYIAGGWYLEITPTYHFSSNGYDLYPYYEEKLSGIKRLERNNAVLGQVIFWARYLTETDLFTSYPYLSFNWLRPLELGVGIEDEAWLKHEEPDEAALGINIDEDSPALDL